jgi:predicted amidohydrolase
MKISLVQFNPVWQNKKESQDRILRLLADNKGMPEAYIFPEMTLTGFTMKAKEYAEELQGESSGFFQRLSDRLHADIFFGMIEADNNTYYNALVHIKNGKIFKTYRKIHPFSYSEENKYYQRGRLAIITQLDNFTAGLSICYDLRFPELYRLYAKERAELMINIANWPSKRIEHWKHLLKARAIENQCYTAGINRVGRDPGNEYNGCSAVYGPSGEEIFIADGREQAALIDLNMELVDEQRSKYPFLNDIYLI